MTIEFHCPHCDKLLKTADDKAGVEAKCPGCGEGLIVPELSERADGDGPSELPVIAETELYDEHGFPSAVEPEELRPCSACGAQISSASERCPICGELLVLEGIEDRPPAQHFVTSDILSRGWTIFQQKFGMLIGVSFLMSVIELPIVALPYVLLVLYSIANHRAEPEPADGVLIVSAVIIPAFVLYWTVVCFLQGGYRRLLIDVAEGRPGSVGQIFAGGRFFIRLFLANLLFAAVIAVGTLLLVAPGVYAFVALWPFSYVLVDQDCGVIEAFERSWKLTMGNRLAGFVLLLAIMGIYVGVSFVPCLGSFAPIVTEPFALLCLAVAYVDMHGRLTAERNPPG